MTPFAPLAVLSVARDRAILYRTWGAAQRAGIPHPTILAEPVSRTGTPTDEARRYLADGTARGHSLAALMQARPAMFDRIETALVVLGEESGSLERSFRWLGEHYERRHREISHAIGKTIYPLMVTLAAALILPIPLLAQGRTGAYAFATIAGLLVWFGAASALVGTLVARKLRQPLLVRARLARGIAIATSAGLPIDSTVRLAVAAADHPEITGYLERISPDRIRSQPMSRTFAACPLVPPEMLAAMRVAEDTGDYETTLGRLAALYEDGFR